MGSISRVRGEDVFDAMRGVFVKEQRKHVNLVPMEVAWVRNDNTGEAVFYVPDDANARLLQTMLRGGFSRFRGGEFCENMLDATKQEGE